ncbi:disulfide bond formation protein B [Tepidimonas aquatica]|uniref:Disulfide bond formation protein B n=1 Tax=Tepidimonas aquatica TaxID=247482 RepID=A0A554WMC7_9BURK|nr:disulfide bond formation protein B [Tepidimonas aquatica]TSE24730.1 Disulfide bond formation protein B [Tepidimonas aquatica]
MTVADHRGRLSALATRLRVLSAGLALWCLGLLGFGLYLQHVVGHEPCPMCIVQRYALIGVALLAALAAALPGRAVRVGLIAGAALVAGFGAFVAARQSWLQWFPPDIQTCGRDFYGMIEAFPLKRAIPMIFRGSGDCTAIDWTWLGLTIANWSFLNFVAMAAVCLALLVAAVRRRS